MFVHVAQALLESTVKSTLRSVYLSPAVMEVHAGSCPMEVTHVPVPLDTVVPSVKTMSMNVPPGHVRMGELAVSLGRTCLRVTVAMVTQVPCVSRISMSVPPHPAETMAAVVRPASAHSNVTVPMVSLAHSVR